MRDHHIQFGLEQLRSDDKVFIKAFVTGVCTQISLETSLWVNLRELAPMTNAPAKTF